MSLWQIWIVGKEPGWLCKGRGAAVQGEKESAGNPVLDFQEAKIPPKNSFKKEHLKMQHATGLKKRFQSFKREFKRKSRVGWLFLRIQKSGMKFQVELQRKVAVELSWMDSQRTWSKWLQINILCPWKCSLNHVCTLLCSKVSVKTQGSVTGSALASCATTAENAGKTAGNHQGAFWKPEGGICCYTEILSALTLSCLCSSVLCLSKQTQLGEEKVQIK